MTVHYSEMEGRAAVITGGGGALGRAVAEKLGENGVRVLITDLSSAALEESVAYLQGKGLSAEGYGADVRDEESMQAVMDACWERCGGLHYLVACAGIFKHRLLEDMTYEEWKETIDVNLNGTFLAVQKALRKMLAAGFGNMVLVSSQSAIRGGPTHVHYGASKGGILTMTRALMREVATRNIRINSVCPGLMVTPMTEDYLAAPEKRQEVCRLIPMGRMGTPRELANVVAFLLSDESSFMTGQTINVTGGAIVNT